MYYFSTRNLYLANYRGHMLQGSNLHRPIGDIQFTVMMEVAGLPETSVYVRRDQLKCDGTRAETRFRLSAKRTSPFKSAGASVQSTGSRGVRISGSNTGYTMFQGAGYSLHSPFSPSLSYCASPCAITFQLESSKQHAPHSTSIFKSKIMSFYLPL